MRLSEAILLGSIGSEQGFGASSGYPNSVKKCAIGAALFAAGVVDISFNNPFVELRDRWPWTYIDVPCPSILGYSSTKTYVAEVIYRLNDCLHWTRPQIAAWVATQEAIYDPQPVELETPALVA